MGATSIPGSLVILSALRALPDTNEARNWFLHPFVARENLQVWVRIATTAAFNYLEYLEYIPKAVLFGLVFYMGKVTPIPGNQFFKRLLERLLLWGIWGRTKYSRDRYVTRVPNNLVQGFTFVQFICLLILYVLRAFAHTNEARTHAFD